MAIKTALPVTSAAYIHALGELKSVVSEHGVRAGLIFLNARTPHRFTALYLFDDETLHSRVFFDSDNPAELGMADIPVLASYCVFVRDRGEPFTTEHASEDERIGDHPKRKVLQAYCGVPLRDVEGRMFGTICHFDFNPTAISTENVELMEAVAPMLSRALG